MSFWQVVEQALAEMRAQLRVELLASITPMHIITILIAFAVGVVGYCLHSAGLYAIAKRRRIYRPWRSWLPIGRSWIIGGISDDYLYICKDKERDWDKLLAKLELASWGLGAVWIVALQFFITKFFTFEILNELAKECETQMAIYPGSSRRYIQYQKLLDTTVGMQEVTQDAVLFILIFMLLILVVMIVIRVLFYKAYYDLFTSCKPNCAAAFLVLSILFPVTLPFFVFACRKHDLGMQEQQSPEGTGKAGSSVTAGRVFSDDP